MQIKTNTWIRWILISLFCFYLWFKLSYPQLAYIRNTINRKTALTIAAQYLTDTGHDTLNYKCAILFSMDAPANQYLQKTTGFQGLKDFVQNNNFDMFLWLVRFYKEQQNEGFRMAISATTGEVVSFKHIISDDESRKEVSKEESKRKVIAFLKKRFDFDEELYSLQGDFLTALDNRNDYSFSWQKKTVSIPWSDEENNGTAKLVTGATISGNEILSFAKNSLKIPEKFSRHLARLKNTGNNISTVVICLYTLLYVFAVYFLVARRNHLAVHTSKRFYLFLAGISFFLSLLSHLNYFQEVLFDYNTTSPLNDYLLRVVLNVFRGAVFINVGLLMPCLSGELLHFEMFKEKKEGAFTHYIHSTFFSKSLAHSILMGYLIAIILLGLQAFLVSFGQKYLGVWVEHSWLGTLSSAYFPFLAALTIGFQASVREEMMFRLFAISWGKKVFKSTIMAVIISSLLWGFTHSGYQVFPMWFRGVEVTILGFFISFVYLRFGLISVIVAHYLFDAFWNSSGYLLGSSHGIFFYSSLIVLFLPFFWAVIAFFINKSDEEKEMKWRLNEKQLFNLDVLKFYIHSHRQLLEGKSRDQIVEQISSRGWDIAVVELAVNFFYKDKKDTDSR